MKPCSVSVQNAQRKIRVPRQRLEEFAAGAFRHCLGIPAKGRSNLTKLTAVHVVLVSDRRIAALHKMFMQIDGATDVLTFQHGEIVISVETARRNARAFRTTTEEELRLYILHGLLHLHGFDDKTPGQARAMNLLQQKILRAIAA